MTVLRNNFNGGPDGTVMTVAASGQDGDDPFNAVSVQGVGATFQFLDASTLERPTAEFVLKCVNGATAAAEGLLWTTAMGTQTQVWSRFYIYLTVHPSGALSPSIVESDNGAAFTGTVEIQTGTGKLRLWNGPVTVSATSTNPLVVNEWARIESRFLFSTTAGSADVRLYLDADSDIPTETISISGCNMGAANSNSYSFGYVFSRANQSLMYLSGLELNNVDWPGPEPFRVGKGSPNMGLTNATAIQAPM